MTNKQAWLGFCLLALIWGSSYMFIRIGVEQVPPFQLVFMRTGIAALGLTITVYARGKRLPSNWRSINDLLFLGIVNTVFPFALITWGETHIESSLASVLQGTSALFSLVFAHFVFADERITWRKVAGLMVGFLGVVVLATRSSGETSVDTTAQMHLLGQLAIVLSSCCYAIGGVYSRKAMQQRLEPIVVAAGAMLVAATITGILAYGVAPVMGGAAPLPLEQLRPNVLGSLLMLGLVNTFVAYLIFYSLIATLGAARTSMVTYVLPVVGLLLGAIFLNEWVDIRLILGAVMIVGSIAIVNLQPMTLINALRWRTVASAPQIHD
ncbi:MAG: EamA family transporter [Caldilineaceae bacterium]